MDTTLGSSVLKSSAYRPAPTYLNKLQSLNVNPSLPQMMDVNTVDPMFRDIAAQYNDRITNLQQNAANVRNQATASQQDIQNAYNVATTNADNNYNSNLDTIRSSNQDTQLSNRLRARATGGAPSSGFLDLANRADVQSQKDVAQAGRQLSSAYLTADQAAGQAMTNILNSLNAAISQIQGDASLSLRQKDEAISSAKSRAASIASQASGIDWNSFLGGFGETPDQTQGDVLPAQQFAPDGAIGSKAGGGLLYKQPIAAPPIQMSSPANYTNLSKPPISSPAYSYGGSSRVK